MHANGHLDAVFVFLGRKIPNPIHFSINSTISLSEPSPLSCYALRWTQIQPPRRGLILRRIRVKDFFAFFWIVVVFFKKKNYVNLILRFRSIEYEIWRVAVRSCARERLRYIPSLG